MTKQTYRIKCKTCGKDAVTLREFTIGKTQVMQLKCGHLLNKEQIDLRDPTNLVSLDNKTLMPFQCKGVKFLEQANGRALVGDEMGLGKTVQILAFERLHPEEAPFIHIVKASILRQWQMEIARWCSHSDDTDDIVMSQIIQDRHIIPGLTHYIVSYDMLNSLVKNGKPKNGEGNGEEEEEEEFDPSLITWILRKTRAKTIVLDECQQVKNPQAKRTRMVRALARDEQIKNIFALSGTAIKNNAAEYWSILNILRPDMFPNYTNFVMYQCENNWSGGYMKTGGLKDPRGFMDRTKGFIIRRERKEVLPELPLITRNYSYCDLGEQVEEAYRDLFKQFAEEYDETGGKGFEAAGNILAYLSKMRHLTGLAKAGPAVDFAEEFLESTDRRLAIFVHHKDVGELVKRRLTKACKELNLEEPLVLTADMSMDARNAVVQKFMAEPCKHRVLIASTLASGEGLNLQKCSDCIMLERQWNPANEEQAEGRFIRIGQQSDKVTATYFVAVGTVDEFFATLVEQKREYVNKSLSGTAIKWDQQSLIKELAEILREKGGRKWGW